MTRSRSRKISHEHVFWFWFRRGEDFAERFFPGWVGEGKIFGDHLGFSVFSNTGTQKIFHLRRPKTPLKCGGSPKKKYVTPPPHERIKLWSTIWQKRCPKVKKYCGRKRVESIFFNREYSGIVKTQRKVMSDSRKFYAKFCPPPPPCYSYSGGLQNGISFFLLGPCWVWKSMLDKSFHFVCFQKKFEFVCFPPTHNLRSKRPTFFENGSKRGWETDKL